MTGNIVLNWIAFAVLFVGALNWGLVGIFGFNLVSFIFGAGIFSAIIYVLVLVSAVWLCFSLILNRALWFFESKKSEN